MSQIPTPINERAIQLDKFSTPYLPAKYVINSTDDFLQIVRVTRPTGTIASIDVQSFFTKILFKETKQIICNNIFKCFTSPPC